MASENNIAHYPTDLVTLPAPGCVNVVADPNLLRHNHYRLAHRNREIPASYSARNVTDVQKYVPDVRGGLRQKGFVA